jgi:hypothetical protein
MTDPSNMQLSEIIKSLIKHEIVPNSSDWDQRMYEMNLHRELYRELDRRERKYLAYEESLKEKKG